MPKQVMVVGLGQFGMALSRSLSQQGVEVLCIDRDPDLINEATHFAAHAVVFDATDQEDLTQAEPKRLDVCVCAIGNEARDASIVCTALLRQLGAPRVIARATDPLHERILLLVGAHEVVSPERAFGARLAARLAYPGVLEQLPLDPDLLITEFEVPERMLGKTLSELALPEAGINVVAVRGAGGRGEGGVGLPRPAQPLSAGEVLVVVGSPDDTSKLLKSFES